jgi:hypothetical protein
LTRSLVTSRLVEPRYVSRTLILICHLLVTCHS